MSSNLITFPNSIVRQKNTGAKNERLRPSVEVPQDFITHFDAFNSGLFDGELSDCVCVYTRKARTLGYYAPDRLERTSGEKCAEIALNPIALAQIHPIVASSVLVHEMAHHWRHTLGPINKKGQRGSIGHHCKSWGAKMIQIGLYPSNTGARGGKDTGQQMMHYIIEGGPFDVLATTLFNRGLRFHWHEAVKVAQANNFDRNNPFKTQPVPPRPSPRKKHTRPSFTCPAKGCGLKAWAKPDARIRCDEHNLLMISSDAGAPFSPSNNQHKEIGHDQ